MSPCGMEEADQLLPLDAPRHQELACSGAREMSPQVQRARREEDTANSFRLSLLYWGVYAVNGGIVGALGPSLKAIERATGLSEAAMGQLVMQNRMAKVVGVGLWTLFTKKCSSRGTFTVDPHSILSLALLTSAMCNAIIARLTHDVFAIRLALIFAGVCYGISDSGIVLLTLWRYNHSDRQQRTSVALLNAAFTVGALLTPVLVAASLKQGSDSRLAFNSISVLALVEALLLPLFSAPNQPVNATSGEQSGPSGHRKVLLTPCQETMLLGSMCVILLCVTGSEHATATWLSSFGVEVGGMSEETMALMSSVFWGFICGGRLIWCVASELISTAWPMLFADILFMLSGSLAFLGYTISPEGNESVLWIASMLIALGVSSSLPCAITLPRECNTQITSSALLAFNVCGTLGETLFPMIIGLAFEARTHIALGILLTSSQGAALIACLVGFTAVGALRRAAKSKTVGENPAVL